MRATGAVSLGLLLVVPLLATADNVRSELLITSFEDDPPKPPCLQIGPWFTPGQALVDATRAKDPDEDRNWVLQVDYQLFTASAYCGLFVKWAVADFDVRRYEALSFFFKGGESYPSVMLAELKMPGSWGWKVQPVMLRDHDPSDRWVRLDLPLQDFTPRKSRYEGDAEIVFTLEAEQLQRLDDGKKQGTFFLDRVCFVEKAQEQ